MVIPLNDPRQDVRTQIFWVGEEKKNKEKLWDWYSFVCRTPQLPGHIILANKQQYSEKAPNGKQIGFNDTYEEYISNLTEPGVE